MKTDQLLAFQAEFLSNEIQPENFGGGDGNTGSGLTGLKTSGWGHIVGIIEFCHPQTHVTLICIRNLMY